MIYAVANPQMGIGFATCLSFPIGFIGLIISFLTNDHQSSPNFPSPSPPFSNNFFRPISPDHTYFCFVPSDLTPSNLFNSPIFRQMPFPLHPRSGTVHPTSSGKLPSSVGLHPSPSSDCSSSPPSSRSVPHFVLFALSGALALALLFIFVLQFLPFRHLDSDAELFSELRLNVDGKQFSIFGRKLVVGDGDYFLNIPYANVTKRFQDFYAIHYGNGCPNGFVYTKPAPGINWNPPPLEVVSVPEQCLTLNIFRCPSPKNVHQLLPVLVYVPEGEWMKRSNANLEPTTTIRELACAGDGGGMVVVAVNYRMGPYGLFNAPHWSPTQKDISLGDIRAALEWVQQNIAHFGGHRAHVTVMARGEGARLVSLLGLVPGTQGLFKRQILVSGSGLVPGLLQTDDHRSDFNPSMHFAIAANCVNEQEWRLLESSRGKKESEEEEQKVRQKLDNCTLAMSHDTIVSAASHIRSRSFIRWPIRAGASLALPANPFLRFPSTATIFAVCSSASDEDLSPKLRNERKSQSEAEGNFRKRLEGALKEEMAERMQRMGDLAGSGFAGEMVRHYLEAIDGPDADPEELFRKITTDLTLIGPSLLESFVRARLGSARVFALLFRSPFSLNMSSVDAAEFGAGATNAWANSQSPCLDDLLFNPPHSDQNDPIERRIVGRFAEIVTNFVTFGDPNPEEHPEQWPIVYPREWKGRAQTSYEDRPQWLDLNGGKLFDGRDLLFPKHNGPRFWLCDMPRRMGISLGDDACPP